ncbi:short-chain dehydrogenase/reductase [Echria macrotheca]|uniref:Short-chain dehydrogenase/reductase n=1 Tax=Echria macrotheca TaxID=438768 RepID=A0AAJ0BND5_9PEZI|nr:short-chain dehydrogenase/reductase [Echria macrotheca]
MAVFQKDNTAVITGGASGIGLALAKRCIQADMLVIIADINADALSRAKTELSSSPRAAVETYRMDVGRAEDWTGLKTLVDTFLNGKISLLALNAGTGPPSSWSTPETFTTTISTNLFGVINGITTFLPTIQSSPYKSSIIITGSKQGITNPPGNPAYNASKSAVRTLAEHLSYDLRDNPQISVHLLVPGWTFTPLAGDDGTRDKPEGAWWPAQVVEYLEAKMREGKFYVVCPDGDVSEEMDKRRMLWGVGDLVEGRPALTRWRGEWRGEVDAWMGKGDV